jgi:hypothetical protein
MKHEFSYTIEVKIKLTRVQAEHIYNMMYVHYDATVREQTTQGHFAFSFVNYYKGLDFEMFFKFREIDLMMKALEMDFSLEFAGLSKYLKSFADAINTEFQRIDK